MGDSKHIVMIHKSGPAFSINEISKAHTELDLARVPRQLHGRNLSLRERIAYLRGQNEQLRTLVGERQ